MRDLVTHGIAFWLGAVIWDWVRGFRRAMELVKAAGDDAKWEKECQEMRRVIFETLPPFLR